MALKGRKTTGKPGVPLSVDSISPAPDLLNNIINYRQFSAVSIVPEFSHIAAQLNQDHLFTGRVSVFNSGRSFPKLTTFNRRKAVPDPVQSFSPDKPQILCYDLFCGEGIVGSVLSQYFDKVIGVDIVNHENRYPGLFIQGDCTQLPTDFFPAETDFIWASPCCQKYSRLTAPMRKHGKVYPETVLPTVSLLDSVPFLSVIENVECAPIRKDLLLCGNMFDLGVIRHRYFQINNGFILRPEHRNCRTVSKIRKHILVAGNLHSSLADAKHAMGFEGDCSAIGLSQGIPSPYVHFILNALGFKRKTFSAPINHLS